MIQSVPNSYVECILFGQNCSFQYLFLSENHRYLFGKDWASQILWTLLSALSLTMYYCVKTQRTHTRKEASTLGALGCLFLIRPCSVIPFNRPVLFCSLIPDQTRSASIILIHRPVLRLLYLFTEH